MRAVKEHFIPEKMKYDGHQLRSHWILNETGVIGDAIVSFQGPADVPIDNMVDIVDVQNNAPISSKLMLHFIVEHFSMSLETSVLCQRLLMAIIFEEIKKFPRAKDVERHGDDIFDRDKKLSVSIAAKSPVSCCIHVGLNIDSEGTPVPTVGLAEYGVDAKRFSSKIMKRYVQEHSQMYAATCKVKPVP